MFFLMFCLLSLGLYVGPMVAMDTRCPEVRIDMSWLDDDALQLSFGNSNNSNWSWPELDNEVADNDQLDYCMIHLEDHDDKFHHVKKWAAQQTNLTRRLQELMRHLVDQNKKLSADMQHLEQTVNTHQNMTIVLSIGTLMCLLITQYQLGLLF